MPQSCSVGASHPTMVVGFNQGLIMQDNDNCPDCGQDHNQKPKGYRNADERDYQEHLEAAQNGLAIIGPDGGFAIAKDEAQRDRLLASARSFYNSLPPFLQQITRAVEPRLASPEDLPSKLEFLENWKVRVKVPDGVPAEIV